MSYGLHGLKALGLSFLAVVGLMAFAAGGAQAKVLVEGLTAPFTVGITGSNDTPGNDRLWVLSLNLEIVCHKSSISSGLMTSSGHGSGTFLLEECLGQGVDKTGKLIGASCKPKPTTIRSPGIRVSYLTRPKQPIHPIHTAERLNLFDSKKRKRRMSFA